MENFFIRSKKYRERQKARQLEKLLCKKKEAGRIGKMVSRRKLAKLERIRRSKKITKEQVPLSHKFDDKDVRKITESLAYCAKLKAKGNVKLFKKWYTACWMSTVL